MKIKQYKKQIAFTIFIICTLMFTNKTLAQGPNAPEAASFEPVDATDMVNLVTGDFTYVLPLLNVPSPEGGYPIALSYHAGIAMDQDASWVGLGWSLNPGYINRGVNGYPDDWGKTNINEFFYDQGWTDDYYSFEAGVTFAGGASVGLGMSWGSGQSLGGHVSASIGVGGKEGASVGVSVGTNGASVFGGIAGFNASIGTNGVGIGYGTSIGSYAGVGIGLNYNYSSGLSGGLSASTVGKASLGISFSSNGVSGNIKGGGVGSGISMSNGGVSGGDYNTNTSAGGFVIPAYIFYVSYSHKHAKHSMFKYSNLYTSGILNPVVANELKSYADSSDLSRLLYENNFMDVNVIPKYDDQMNLDILLNTEDQIDKNNLILPNYDNYSVNAQGLSGILKPYLFSELNLSGRGRGMQNGDNLYASYLNNSYEEYQSAPSSGIDVNRDAIRKVHFTMDNAHNSFLRVNRSNILETSLLPSFHSDYIMSSFNTEGTNNFNNDNSVTNNYERKKREGNYIETYTNKQIRDSYSGGLSNIPNFIDAKQFNNLNVETNLDRSNTNTFLDDGIGAYQITTSDGRTYHYSLPVYNFESYYKNFKDATNENINFFELQKTSPYATHWLLTAITGPDYIDVNTNGYLDENDYGYWVAFDYGKWSDGYAWKTPNGRYQINKNRDGNSTYSYAWGRKQIYYLDAIKTRTHTALFIKDLREDNKSEIGLSGYNTYHSSGSFNFNQHPKVISSGNEFKPFGNGGDTYYANNGSPIILPKRGDNNYWITDWVGRENIASYVDIPEGYSLKLSKIILLKNENATYSKNNGNLTPTLNGQIYSNKYISGAYSEPVYDTDISLHTQKLYVKPNQVKSFQTNVHQNIFDVADVAGLNIENKAQQTISFNYDYSLAKSTPSSEASSGGRLSLKKINYQGKKGNQIIPPYEFSYLNSTIPFDKESIDVWGYNKDAPQVWSLNKIKMPIGGEINIEYEEDSYYAEAAFSEEQVTLSSAVSLINEISPNLMEFQLNSTFEGDPNDFFIPERYYNFTFEVQLWHSDAGTTDSNITSTEYIPFRVKVVSVESDKIVIEIPIQPAGFETYLNQYQTALQSPCSDISSISNWNTVCVSSFKLNGQIQNYTLTNNNGKKGGGLRTKSITVSNGVNDIATSEYIYTNPETNKISGITSYAPSDDSKGIPYVSELPPPMVTYANVKMINKDGNGVYLGASAYEFGALEPFHLEPGYIYSLGDTFRVKEIQEETFQNGGVIANKYELHNSLGNIGRLLSVKSYNNQNQIINTNINTYKANLNGDIEIGVTQESHKSYKRVLTANSEKFYVSSTSRVNYPNVLESKTSTQGSYSNTTYFTKHDFLTGQVLETINEDSKGNRFKTELIPAYTILEYNSSTGYGMGSKVDDITNKNMLSQEAMRKTYLEVDGEWKETGVGITTWNNEWIYPKHTTDVETPTNASEKIWRKHKNYVWDGAINEDGTYLNFSDTDPDDGFDWTIAPANSETTQSNPKWKNISTTTKYDHYSMPLEVRDINLNYATTKMCDDNTKVLFTVNSKYYESFYTGGEYEALSWGYIENQIKGVETFRTEEQAHTGKYSIKLIPGDEFGGYLKGNEHRTGKYKMSVWVHKDNYQNARFKQTLGGTLQEYNGEKVFAGDWVQLNHYFDKTTYGSRIYMVASASGTIYIDDFRMHPIASSMTSYVYNEWDELEAILGANNLATKFEYDSQGRLIATYSEVIDTPELTGGFKKASENFYNYKNQE